MLWCSQDHAELCWKRSIYWCLGVKAQSMILNPYTFWQSHWISPHGPLAVCLAYAFSKTETESWTPSLISGLGFLQTSSIQRNVQNPKSHSEFRIVCFEHLECNKKCYNIYSIPHRVGCRLCGSIHLTANCWVSCAGLWPALTSTVQKRLCYTWACYILLC